MWQGEGNELHLQGLGHLPWSPVLCQERSSQYASPLEAGRGSGDKGVTGLWESVKCHTSELVPLLCRQGQPGTSAGHSRLSATQQASGCLFLKKLNPDTQLKC